MHEDPFISTIYKLDVTISFTSGHAEKRKKRKDWTWTDKGNIAADWITRGRFKDVFAMFNQATDLAKVHTINFNNSELVS